MTDVSSPLRWLGGQIDLRVEIASNIVPEGGGAWDIGEWDEAVWSETALGFQDITEYLLSARINRGQQRFDQRFEAGHATFVFDNRTGLFSQDAGETPWSARFRPGRLIRIVVIPDPDVPEVAVARFTGRIDSSTDEFDQGNYDVVTVITAIDALGDLHDYNPVALEVATGVESTSERVVTVLDRMGWPVEARQISPGLHTMATSFLAQSALEECQRAAEAEGGALFANGDNVIVFRNRDWLTSRDPSMLDYEAAVLALEPVAYWRMSGAAATADETGNGHTLTWSGSPATQQPGVTDDDDAVALDGTNDVATVASEAALELEQDMSVEFWARPHDDAGADNTVISCRASADPLYEIMWDPAASRYQFFPTANAGSGSDIGADLEANEWHHVVVTIAWGTSTRTVRTYINGTLFSTDTWDYQPTPTSPVINIGRRAIGNDLHFDGDLSELAVYDFVLTPAQVLSNYNAKDTATTSRSVNVQGYIGYAGDLPMEYAGEPTAETVDRIRTPWELQRVRNDVQFARTDGALQTVEDLDSQGLYGVRSYSRRDFNNNDDAEVLFLAERNLAAYKDARPVLEPVTIVANDDPDNDDLNRLYWDSRLGDLHSVRIRTPYGWGSDRLAHVIGIAEFITGNEWQVTFTHDDSLISVLNPEE